MTKTEEIKNKLGAEAKDIIVKGLDLEEGIAGKYVCPMHDEDTASLSWFEQGNTFKCFGCGGTMDIFDYYKGHLGYNFEEAVSAVADLVGVSLGHIDIASIIDDITSLDPVYDYLISRGIDYKALHLPKQYVSAVKGHMAFVHYSDFGIDGLRYRRLDNNGNKYWMANGSHMHFWLKDLVDVTKPVVLVEGEIDNLTLRSMGFKNVMSYGSSSSIEALLKHDELFIKSLSSVVLLCDNDEAGDKARAILQKTFSANNVEYVDAKYINEDANEDLELEGYDSTHKLILTALQSLEEVEDVVQFSDMVYDKWDNNELYGVETSIPKLDTSINDIAFGDLMVLYGRTGAGKTTFAGQMMLSAIRLRIKTFVFNGELTQDNFMGWLYSQCLGDPAHMTTYKKNKIYVKAPKPRPKAAIDEWTRDQLYVYHRKSMKANQQDVMSRMVKMAERGVKFFVIDNLMSILETSASSVNHDQQSMVQSLRDFAKFYNVAVLLVVHPNKNKDDGERLTMKDISGSSTIQAIANTVVAIEKADDQYTQKIEEYADCDAVLRILKARETDTRGYIQLNFDTDTKRFTQLDGVGYGALGWEKLLKEDVTTSTEGFNITSDVSDDDQDLI